MISAAAIPQYMIGINERSCVHRDFSVSLSRLQRLSQSKQLLSVSCRLARRGQQQSAASTASLPPSSTYSASSIAWLAMTPTRLPLLEEEPVEVVAPKPLAAGLRPQAAQGVCGGPGTGSTCSASRRAAPRHCTWQLSARVLPCLYLCGLGAHDARIPSDPHHRASSHPVCIRILLS